MRVEYQTILDEFFLELDAASELVLKTDSNSFFGMRARISLANCVTLLLCSIFEEYVRQLVIAGWRQKRKLANSFADLPNDIRSTLWTSGMQRVARLKSELDSSATRSRAEGLILFCIDQNLNADVEKDISHNDSNMRPAEIVRLFNQIGARSIFNKACEEQSILEHFNEDNPNEASKRCNIFLTDFINRRNEITHAMTFGSSSGATNLNNDIAFLKALALGLARALESY